MNFSDIKIFYEVATLESTTKAANKLRYEQSNISKRIAKLEDTLHISLFQRSNKGMFLTEDGKLFFSYVEKLLAPMLEIENTFLTKEKRIRIGATQSISRNYLQKYFFEKNMNIYTNSSANLITQLENYQLDFIIINNKLNIPSFKKILTIEENVHWAKSRKNKNNFSKNTIAVSRDLECPCRIETMNYLALNKIDNIEIIEADTIDIVVSLIESEKVIAILPEKTIISNSLLERASEFKCNNTFVHVYTQIDNSDKFEINLSN